MDEQNMEGLHGITITEPKKCDWKWKIFVWFKYILSKYICFLESVTLLTISQKVQILNAWKDNFGESCACKLLYFLFSS